MTLKEYRTAKKLTQAEMVELLKPQIPGLTRPMYSLLERGVLNTPIKLPCIQDEDGFTASKTNLMGNLSTEALKPLKNDFEASKVYNALIHSETPLTRADLSLITGMSDRKVRLEIEELRRQGARILSSSNRPGYWMGDETEYKAFRNEMLSRIRAQREVIKAMDGVLPGQVTMDEQIHGCVE